MVGSGRQWHGSLVCAPAAWRRKRTDEHAFDWTTHSVRPWFSSPAASLARRQRSRRIGTRSQPETIETDGLQNRSTLVPPPCSPQRRAFNPRASSPSALDGRLTIFATPSHRRHNGSCFEDASLD